MIRMIYARNTFLHLIYYTGFVRAGYDVPEEKALWLYTKAHIQGLQLQWAETAVVLLAYSPDIGQQLYTTIYFFS